MADYRYVSTWQLQAPIEPVWAALNDLEHLPAWYRAASRKPGSSRLATPRASAAGSGM